MHIKSVHCPPRSDERLLSHVLGESAVAQPLSAVPHQTLVIERIELTERIGVPSLTSPDEEPVALEVHVAADDDGHP
jgi:hypothetical protein